MNGIDIRTCDTLSTNALCRDQMPSMDEQPNFETALEKLEAAVDRLEQGELPLEDALRTFEDGVRWSRACHQLLDRAEQRVEVILKNEQGEHEAQPFVLGDES